MSGEKATRPVKLGITGFKEGEIINYLPHYFIIDSKILVRHIPEVRNLAPFDRWMVLSYFMRDSACSFTNDLKSSYNEIKYRVRLVYCINER